MHMQKAQRVPRLNLKQLLAAVATTVTAATAAPTASGVLIAGGLPLPVEVGRDPTCLDFPHAIERMDLNLSRIGVQVEGSRACFKALTEGVEEGKVILGEKIVTLRFYLREGAPATEYQVRFQEVLETPQPVPASPSDKAPQSQAAASPTTAIPILVTVAGDSLDDKLLSLLEVLVQHLIKDKAQEGKPQTATATPQPQTKEPPKLPQPPAPALPATSAPSLTVKESERKWKELNASVSFQNSKIWIGFTLLNTKEAPIFLDESPVEVLFNGKPVKGEAKIRYTSGVAGWLPPGKQAVGSIQLDLPVQSGQITLKIKGYLMDGEMPEVSWQANWTVDLLPVAK